ncbi:MAG: hypothetical protein ACD_48C00526G0003, partial [uncultured bacterium]
MLTQYKLHKPDLSRINEAVLTKKIKNSDALMEAMHAINDQSYLYWDKIQYSAKIPNDTTPEEFWYFVKQVRKYSSRKSVIKAESGEQYSWVRLNYTDEYLHKLDMQLGTNELVFLSKTSFDAEQKKRFLTKSIMEEAIASSQLEGAATTTSMAKKLLSEKRTPKDKSERMIVNNYKTMQALNQDYKDKELSH